MLINDFDNSLISTLGVEVFVLMFLQKVAFISTPSRDSTLFTYTNCEFTILATLKNALDRYFCY